MDPVASILTILGTIREGVKAAKKLYNAPSELEELQAEVNTLVIVLNSIVVDAWDLANTNRGIGAAIKSAQECLLDLRQLIEFELIKEVPEGIRARRSAWVRKVHHVHEMLCKLSDRRANVVLALHCETAVTTKRHGETLNAVHSRALAVEQQLHIYGEENRHRHTLLMDALLNESQRWENHRRQLEIQQQQHYSRLNDHFSDLLGSLLLNDNAQHAPLSWPNTLSVQKQLLHSPVGTKLLPPVPGRQNSPRQLLDSPLESAFFEEQVLQHLHSCTSGHSMCNSVQHSSVPLPTRLLNVGNDGSEVFLYEPGHSERAPYTTLSYCWGMDALIVTTDATLESRKLGIVWKTIPSLFQDAIRITRMLKIQYLWIDALCIVQDNMQDWMRESGSMASIFENATVVLTAISARDPSSRLLGESSIENGSMSGVHEGPHDDRTVYEAIIERRMAPSQWFRRGWTMQERLLSKRALHFGQDTVVWECNHSVAPLSRASEAVDLLTRAQRTSGLKALTSTTSLGITSKARNLGVWWQVVEEYSSRQVTFASDKLVALSGLAERFSTSLGPYAAGLWETQDFVRNLNWKPKFTSARHPVYVGPTWSWVSVDGEVAAPAHAKVRFAADVVELKTTPLGENKFGALEAASLKLKSTFVKAQVALCEDQPGQSLVTIRKGDWTLTTEADIADAVSPGDCVSLLNIYEDTNGNVACLVLCRGKPQSLPTQSWQRVAALQLEKRRGEQRWFVGAEEDIFKIV